MNTWKKTIKSPYCDNGLTNRPEIWHNNAEP